MTKSTSTPTEIILDQIELARNLRYVTKPNPNPQQDRENAVEILIQAAALIVEILEHIRFPQPGPDES